MSQFSVNDDVTVLATSEHSTIVEVIKKWFGQDKYRLRNGGTYKESELARYYPEVTVSTAAVVSSDPDVVTQVVMANLYMNQMQDVVETVQEANSTIPEPIQQSVSDSVAKEPSFYEDRQERWEAPVSTESKSVDVDTSSSHSVSVDDSSSSWRSSSVDDSSSYSSRFDDSSYSSGSSYDSGSYDSGSSSSSSSDF